MKSVLLVGPYGIGNLIMASPAICSLSKLKDYQIDILCLLESTYQLCSDTKLRQYFRDIYKIHFGQNRREIFKEIIALRKLKYDYSILLFPSPKIHYNLLNYILGAKKKIGSKYENQPLGQGSWLNKIGINVQTRQHDVVQNYTLLNKGLNLELHPRNNYLLHQPPKKKHLMGIHAGCKPQDSYKRWSKENFLITMKILANFNQNLHFKLFFGPDETDDYHRFRYLINRSYEELKKKVLFFVAKPIQTLFPEMGECYFFLANDSGLMHLAACQGVKTLGIFGPSDEKRTGPLTEYSETIHSKHDCRPCTHTNDSRKFTFRCIYSRQICLNEITPNEVSRWFKRRMKIEK